MPELFAVIPVSDYVSARPWYERLFGGDPAFEAHETECVWQICEEGHVAVNEDQERAGRTSLTIFADDLDSVTAEIAERGLEPADTETYSNGVRKAIYRDADGNEIGLGGSATAGDR